jgi:hypothetical protein
MEVVSIQGKKLSKAKSLKNFLPMISLSKKIPSRGMLTTFYSIARRIFKILNGRMYSPISIASICILSQISILYKLWKYSTKLKKLLKNGHYPTQSYLKSGLILNPKPNFFTICSVANNQIAFFLTKPS